MDVTLVPPANPVPRKVTVTCAISPGSAALSAPSTRFTT
jgi:hypothetical protein